MRPIGRVWTLLVGAWVLGGCGGKEQGTAPPQHAASGAALATLQASPCDLGTTSVLGDSAVARALTGADRVDSEVTDCQRLVVSTGAAGEFGPLVGLYPVDATAKLARTDFTTARPAVALYSWGAAGGSYAETYPDFAPATGAACLWLRNGDGSAAGWKAALAGGSACGVGAAAPGDSAFSLPVFEHVVPGTSAADYPRTARWEWDRDGTRQLIGVKCGDAWCEIAARGSAAPKAQPLEGGNGVPREQVPGWSDAQFLAVYDSAAGRARPGPWAAIVAYPGIAADAPPWTEGLLSAHIVVYGAAGAFGDRFYLQPERGSGHDELILRFPGMQDEAWLQQGPMRRRKANRIQFAPTVSHGQVGTVRWRWNERGENVWIYCPNGTCAVEP